MQEQARNLQDYENLDSYIYSSTNLVIDHFFKALNLGDPLFYADINSLGVYSIRFVYSIGHIIVRGEFLKTLTSLSIHRRKYSTNEQLSREDVVKFRDLFLDELANRNSWDMDLTCLENVV